MKEQIKENWKWIKWIVIGMVVWFAIYMLIPKYYFISWEGRKEYTCNRITGHCKAHFVGGLKVNLDKLKE